MMLRIPALLSPDEVRQCRQALEQAPWQDGRATAGPLAAQVKANLQLPLDSQAGQAIGNLILDKLGASALFMSATLPLKVLPPRFNRYEGGGHYGYHVDGAVMALPGGGQLRSDLSCTLFLAEPDEYDGGELVVNDTYGEHEAKLPAGDLLLYPSSSLHEVRPVTRGARLAAFFWIQSLVRHEEQRRLLFDLDVAIQSLTAKPDTDRSTLLSLTGVYHNLLRQWSET